MLRRHSWFAIGVAVLQPIVAVRAQSSGVQSGAERFGIVALQVIDDVTDAPLPGVRVSILGDSTERLTDANGRAVLVARRAGRIPVVLRRLGYMPGSVMADQSASDTTRLTFAMSKVVQTLATVAVSEEALTNSSALTGFDRRRRLGVGSSRYLTREDIERARPMRTSDVLNTIPSMYMMMDGTRPIPMNRRGTTMGSKGCAYQIGLDGHLMEGGFDMNTVDPDEVFGVEVFNGPATIPLEYRSSRRSSGCGLIMIWTRRGT
jgi:hypothetical protein